MNRVVSNPISYTGSRITTGWVVFGISLVLFLLAVVVQLVTPTNLPPYQKMSLGDIAEGYVDGLGFLSFGLAGALLLNRGNRAGWAYLVPAVCYNLGLNAALYAVNGVFGHSLPLAVQSALLMNALFLPTIVAALVFVPVLYPFGRTTRVWRILLTIMAVLVGLFDLLAMVTPGPVNAPDYPMPNPWGQPGIKPVIDVVSGVTLAAFIGLAVAAAVWTIWRWRRTQGEERRAYRLFLIGELIFLVMFLSDNVMQPILPVWAWLAPLVAIPAIPVMTYIVLLRKPGLLPRAAEPAASSSNAPAR